MGFPASRPDADLDSVWDLQNKLLELLAKLIGERDKSKKLHRPVFGGDVPMLASLPGSYGVVALLSKNAAGYWPSVVFELAHETVHALNPVPGHTNYLEEGIAVAFSLHALAHYQHAPMKLGPAYAEALQLVEELPGGAFAAAKALRASAGSLGAVTVDHLKKYAPDHAIEKLERLASQCVPR